MRPTVLIGGVAPLQLAGTESYARVKPGANGPVDRIYSSQPNTLPAGALRPGRVERFDFGGGVAPPWSFRPRPCGLVLPGGLCRRPGFAFWKLGLSLV